MQQKHIIPIKKASRPLFGSGAEKTLPYLLSDDFVDKAEKAGVVERIDKKINLAVLKYDDGTRGVIDLAPVMSKNSNGGLKK